MLLGWGVGAAMYTTKIKEVMGKIRLTLPHVLPLNRSAVDEYLRSTWTQTLKLILGIRSETSWILEGRFQDYFEFEEQRIRSHLELIRYHIDAPETISLVLGPGRLEKVFATCLSKHFIHPVMLKRSLVDPAAAAFASTTRLLQDPSRSASRSSRVGAQSLARNHGSSVHIDQGQVQQPYK